MENPYEATEEQQSGMHKHPGEAHFVVATRVASLQQTDKY
jgi:hypothetical protein